jgi:hypothetical protein
MEYIFSVITFIIFIIYFFWPFNSLFYKQRICLIIIAVKCFLPITNKGVKFKDFIFADIFTSFAIAIVNITVGICLLYCKECKLRNEQFGCHMNYAIPAIIIIPVLTRILQCLNLVYYGQKRKIEIINAVKYTIHMIDLITGYLYLLKIVTKEIYIIVISISSIYLLSFDNN